MRRGSVGPASVSASAITHHRIRGPISVRSSCNGSSREARHAGARQARTATANSVAITPERTTGSRGLFPESMTGRCVLPRSSTASQGGGADADHRTAASTARVDRVARRAPCEFPARKFWRDTARWQRNHPVRIQLRPLKVPTNPLKLLI
jgi:hypothetical protein